MDNKPSNMASKQLSKDGSVHVTNEMVNTITHLIGACFALLGAVLLISQASVLAQPWKIVGLSIYGFSLLNLFVFSTLHHGINGSERLNQILRTLDYASVFGLIAGTVTPIVLVRYRNIFGWSVLGVVWAIAIIGIVLRSVNQQIPKHITNTLYIVLGWIPIALIGAGNLLPLGALILLAGGGLLYSIGFGFYTLEKPNIKPGIFGFHELWHCLVLLAAAMHYLLIYIYILRY